MPDSQMHRRRAFVAINVGEFKGFLKPKKTGFCDESATRNGDVAAASKSAVLSILRKCSVRRRGRRHRVVVRLILPYFLSQRGVRLVSESLQTATLKQA